MAVSLNNHLYGYACLKIIITKSVRKMMNLSFKIVYNVNGYTKNNKSPETLVK